MFITNHVVEDAEERHEILSKFPSMGSLDTSSLELLAVAMDDEDVVGCAATSEISSQGSRLLGFDLVGKYAKRPIEVGLFNYLAWELKEKRKSFLLIEPGLKNRAASEMLRDMGCDSGERAIIKIDWIPPSTAVFSST